MCPYYMASYCISTVFISKIIIEENMQGKLEFENASEGAKFIITPGFNTKVVQWCLDHDVEVYPGVSTASEVEMALSMGLTQLKFFPAESSGGAKKLKDLSAPYANVHFMPTGGINTKNMHDYLSLPNVEAIGGSFMLPNDLVSNNCRRPNTQ